ncbi:glycosyltransferase family 4 protein [Desulforhopalus sp. 52FAK]
MRSDSILLMFHCSQNTGYAIEKLEKIFFKSAQVAGFNVNNIIWSFSELVTPQTNTYCLNYQNEESAIAVKEIIDQHQVSTILAFDLPYPTSIAKAAKEANVKRIISYSGASMSGLNKGLSLLAKKIEWFFRRQSRPNFFIFESKAMQHTATHGRGVPEKLTTVIPLGVDTDCFFPSEDKSYIKNALKIPLERHVVFYSGHMEERKGVRVIVRAAKHLAATNKIQNIHFVLCGNVGSEADTYIAELNNSYAKSHVTFAGYRSDIPKLMQSSDLGAIVSTGWDSFTRSAVELLSSGVPLIVSNLGGLIETTKHNETGYVINPSDPIALADKIYKLINDQGKLKLFGKNARLRAKEKFSEKTQIDRIASILINR